MPPQTTSSRTVKGIELSYQAKRYKYLIPKDSGHDYVYLDPIESVKMDSPQAKLRLSGDSHLELRNCPGNFQTFIKKKTKKDYVRVLASDYTKVEDGDRLVFGPPSDSAVEFQVSVLYDNSKSTPQKSNPPKPAERTKSNEPPTTKNSLIQTTKSSSGRKGDQAQKPTLRKTRSAENMNLKPPTTDKNIKRKSDGNLQQASKTSKQGNDENKKKPVNLNLPQMLDDIQECSSSTQLGDGYNALTRSFTGHCALADPTPNKKAKDLPLENFDPDIFVLAASSSFVTVDEIGLGAGARLSSDVSLRAAHNELAEMHKDVTKIFVKYVRKGSYWQSIKSPVHYRRSVDTKNNNFWTQYGDYYVSDIERQFGCWVIMIFHVENLRDIDQTQTDIEARVRDIFEAKANFSEKMIEDRRWSMYRVICRCYGYSQDILSRSTGLTKISDVLNFVDNINSIPPPGVVRRVKLTRYPDISPEITIPKYAYNELLELHKLSAQLSEKTLNLAILRNTRLLEQINSLNSTFRSDSVNFFDRTRKCDNSEYQERRKDMKKRLKETSTTADVLINRSGLIFKAQKLLKRGKQIDTPRDRSRAKVWRWRCGMTGTFRERGKNISEKHSTPYTTFTGEFTPQQCPDYSMPSQDVTMLSWTFSALQRSRLWSTSTEVICQTDTDLRKSPQYNFEDGTSKLILRGDQPIFIIGWVVKCEHVDEHGELSKGKDGQSLRVWVEPLGNEQGDSGLLDYFHVKVRSTDRIKCTVQVFYVYKKVFSGVL